MAKKRSPKRKKSKDKTATLRPEEAARLEGLLARAHDLDPSGIRDELGGPETAAAFLQRLPAADPELVPLLGAIREAYQEKEVRKALRRAAFRFEQKGIPVPDETEKDPPALRAVPGTQEAFAYLTPFEALGDRSVLLAAPSPSFQLTMCVGIVHDLEGIKTMTALPLNRKKAREARNVFLQDFPHAVEASPGHALGVLERAYQADRSSPGASDYLQLRPLLLSALGPGEEAPIQGLIPPDSGAGLPFTESMAARLMDHELFRDWILDPEEVDPLADEIREAEESPLHLTQEQVSARVEELEKKAVQRIFTETRRNAYRFRLAESAYILHMRGEEEYARLALRAALSLDEPDSLFQVNPFLMLLTQRCLAMAYEEPETEQEPLEPAGPQQSLTLPGLNPDPSSQSRTAPNRSR